MSNDEQYMKDLRTELVKQKVTQKRLRKLGGLPLTAAQVAFAIKKYVVSIEKRRKRKTK